MRNVIASAAMLAIEDHFKDIGALTNLQRRNEALKLSKKNSWMYGTVERNAQGKVVHNSHVAVFASNGLLDLRWEVLLLLIHPQGFWCVL
jgi:hypothetical protein